MLNFNEFLKDPNANIYTIAEIGVNHEGSIKKAKEMIKDARDSGASCVKFQTYKAETIASKNSPYYWDINKEPTKSQFQLFKKYDSFNKNDYIDLADYANQLGINFSSTPFDLNSVDFLKEIVPFFKIASADMTNDPLLKKIGQTKKDIILSTGASSIDEIKYSYNFLYENGARSVSILHCVLNYPTLDSNASLSFIEKLKQIFPNEVIGYSDHTIAKDDDYLVLTSALGLGARIIEKHFTYDKRLEGNDHYHAFDKYDLKNFFDLCERFLLIYDRNFNSNSRHEELLAIQNARRSILSNKNIKKGDKIQEHDLICKRPGNGISPREINKLIGQTLLVDIKEDHMFTWDDVDEN